ncbi:MAG: hypothetical protein HFG80_05060 [Eubacterium sp.]|nr:hypothetical protein [Eubacterium sp.]
MGGCDLIPPIQTRFSVKRMNIGGGTWFSLCLASDKKFFYIFALADCTKYFVLPVSSNGFSNRPDLFITIHAITLDSPSGLSKGFSGHPCPEIAVFVQDDKKISFSCTKATPKFFVQSYRLIL